MTSNLAIKPSTDIASPAVPSGDIFKSLTTTPTGRGALATGSRTPTAATTATGATGADPAMLLAAGGGGLVRQTPPRAQIQIWKENVQPRVAPKAPQPAGFDRSPVIDRPTGGSKTPGAAADIFSPGSRKVVVPGLAVLTRPVDKSILTNLNEALTGTRVAKFNQLTPGQQKVARALLEAVLEGMGKAPGDKGRIDPKNMGALVDLVLKEAKSMTVADEVPAGARNRPKTPTNVAVDVEPKRPAAPIVKAQQPVAPVAQAVVPVAPTAQAVEPVTPVTPPVAAAETTPATPTTGAGAITPATPATPVAPATPTTPANAQPAVAWPFAGETAPAWFAPAIAYDPNPQSPTYQPDRDMGSKVVKLVVDSREFAAQAATIQVTPELTSRWNTWKIA